jgi:hypothetical protein
MMLVSRNDKHAVKVKKIKLSHYCHVCAKGERICSSHSFLTLALNGVSGQSHALAVLYPWEWTPGTQWMRGWVGLRVRLGEKSLPLLGIEPGFLVCSQTLY